MVPVIQFKWLFLFGIFSDGFFSVFFFSPKAIVDLESRRLQACLLSPGGVCYKTSPTFWPHLIQR